jgi:hypothetical protein
MLEFTLSSKQAKELIFNGHIFQKSKTNYSKTQEVNSIYWKCSKNRGKENLKCNAACLTSSDDITGTILVSYNEHNHSTQSFSKSNFFNTTKKNHIQIEQMN